MAASGIDALWREQEAVWTESGEVGGKIDEVRPTTLRGVLALFDFAVETDGLTATFHNRYAGEGWWDFGDGAPLEPALPQQPSISHTYAKPGTFPAKLMVRNYVGDEHEPAPREHIDRFKEIHGAAEKRQTHLGEQVVAAHFIGVPHFAIAVLNEPIKQFMQIDDGARSGLPAESPDQLHV